ncbi:MAG TPA: outer membrane protein assembly factor BamC [Gammaproteobacteria bacterium]|nr:outer membrane protein assembly factor BamC [Gammaproteobacteria bacterium]
MSVRLIPGKNLALLILSLAMMACSSTGPHYEGDYNVQNENGKPLEVPPGLVLPRGDESLKIPSIAAEQTSIASYEKKGTVKNRDGSSGTATAGVRMRRDGAVRWLEFDAPADKVWSKLESFFKSLGFKIVHEDKKLGMMETDWQENRVKLPSDWFSVIFNSFSSAGLKDRYIARLEQDGDKTLLFITHQGLREKHIEDDTSDADDTYWEYRKSDPGLEREMLMRFLIFQGIKKNTAKAITTKKEISHAKLVEEKGNLYLNVTETFPRTWRRVGLAMDRMGIHVDDRNRSAGVYYFSLNKDFRNQEDKNWFEGIFGNDVVGDNNAFILKLDTEDDVVQISMRRRGGGQILNSKLSRLILTKLQKYLK